jgi:hypothetical protein
MRNIFIQILPQRVFRFNQLKLLYPRSALHLLFPQYGQFHRSKLFIPNEHFAAIALREAFNQSFTMLINPLRKIGGNSSINNPIAPIRLDIDARIFHAKITLPPLRGASRRSNPVQPCTTLDCRATLAMTKLLGSAATPIWLRWPSFISRCFRFQNPSFFQSFEIDL